MRAERKKEWFILGVLLIYIGIVPIMSEDYATSWSKTFGGPQDDYCFGGQQTNDGGFILWGATFSKEPNKEDAWLLKIDAEGNKKWDKTFGGKDRMWMLSAQLTRDDGYILAPNLGIGSPEKRYAILIKTDSNGTEIWNRTIGGPFITDAGGAWSVRETTDGGYILVGNNGAGGWVVKTNSNGTEVWNKTFNVMSKPGTSNVLRCVRETHSGDYIIAGQATGVGWLLKIDSKGNILWEKTFENSAQFRSVEETSDGGYLLTQASTDIRVIKTDLNGNVIWDKTFGGPNEDQAYSAVEVTGGYLIIGDTKSYGSGKFDIWLIKLDRNGNKIWDKTFGGAGDDSGKYAQGTSDGGCIIMGQTTSYGTGKLDAWLIKLNLK